MHKELEHVKLQPCECLPTFNYLVTIQSETQNSYHMYYIGNYHCLSMQTLAVTANKNWIVKTILNQLRV